MRWTTTLLLGSVALASCGQDACPSADDAANGVSVPSIDKLWLVDHAMPDDPWALVLALTFHDSTGDLGPGNASIYINGHDQPATLDLFPSFRESALAPDSTSGTLTLPAIRISNVSNDDTVRLGVRLTDADGRRGNCYGLDLTFGVKAALNVPQQWLRRWAGLWDSRRRTQEAAFAVNRQRVLTSQLIPD